MLGRVSVVIGLTGGIGSGKSTVARMLATLGATVIDADAIVQELQAPGAPMVAELAECFGNDILDADGALDRKALGDIVFHDDAARKRLNQIVHPQVSVQFARRVTAARERNDPLIVLDIPLLFENQKNGTGTASRMDFDATVLVFVELATQIERTMARDGCTREEACARIRAQLPLAEKRQLADHVIENEGPLAETERQVQALFTRLRAMPAKAR